MCRIISLVVKFYSFVDGCVRVSRMAFCTQLHALMVKRCLPMAKSC